MISQNMSMGFGEQGQNQATVPFLQNSFLCSATFVCLLDRHQIIYVKKFNIYDSALQIIYVETEILGLIFLKSVNDLFIVRNFVTSIKQHFL